MASRTSKHQSESPCHVRPLARQKSLSKNATAYLELRSRGIFFKDSGTLLRRNFKIFREIIFQDSKEFKKVWTKSSKSPISYECGRIYFDNFRCCYSSLSNDPRLMYELPKRSKTEKIEDSLLCQCPLDQGLPRPLDQKPCLLALTADNQLHRFSIDTGKELQKISLSPHYKFKYLGWDVAQETFYIKSIQNKETSMQRQLGLKQNTLMYLAVFRVFPLQLMGVLEIKKSVFGNTVVDVILSQGVLAVSHSTKNVKFYSLEFILNKFLTKELVLGQWCDWNGISGTVGEAPFGIPVNVEITECLSPLFEVSCFDNSVQIGGHPWHYIYTPNHKKHLGSYHICSLKDGTLASNGIQDMKCYSLESDWIYFHPDDSGRIIHVGPSTINFLRIFPKPDCEAQFEVAQEFSLTAHQDSTAYAQATVTSSGRTVKRRVHQLDDDPEQKTFKMVEYEDELDLLAVVEVTHTGDEGQAYVGLHDNLSGVLMKKIPLKESWDVTYRHDLLFDRDTIVHIEQQKNSNFYCHVYKMTSRQLDTEKD